MLQVTRRNTVQSEQFTALPKPPDEEELAVVAAVPLTGPSDNDADAAKQKPIVANDANNNGIPERDRNANQTKSHVCQECGKKFVTKASLKVKLNRS